jgi:hypothetical protein
MTSVIVKTGNLLKIPAKNVQISHDSSSKNARSESVVAADPDWPNNVVCASKRFRAATGEDPSVPAPQDYDFVIAPFWSRNGGISWQEAPPLQLEPEWQSLSDPALAWDRHGNVYLLVLAGGPGPDVPILGVAIYRSKDGGQTWSAPSQIHNSNGDDKGWMTADPTSGRPYAAWDDNSLDEWGTPISGEQFLSFTRAEGSLWTLKSKTELQWEGPGKSPSPAGEHVPGVSDSFSPTLTVSGGVLWIFWLAGTTIKYVTSSDHGVTFQGAYVAAEGITPLSASNIDEVDGWLEFPGTTFRVETFPTSCASGNVVIVAWTDARETNDEGQHVARIYHRRVVQGEGWIGDQSGEPLLADAAVPASAAHAFHPQLAAASDGTVGCGFYELGPKGEGGEKLIDVVLATPSLVTPPDWLGSLPPLSKRAVVTDSPWDPTVDAPWAHGDHNVTFIGDYFGVCAAGSGWDLVWTDTRTGVQELFFSRVAMETAMTPIPDSVLEILFGVTQDGPGVAVTPDGRVIHIEPDPGPAREALIASMIAELATQMSHGGARDAIETATKDVVAAVETATRGRID